MMDGCSNPSSSDDSVIKILLKQKQQLELMQSQLDVLISNSQNYGGLSNKETGEGQSYVSFSSSHNGYVSLDNETEIAEIEDGFKSSVDLDKVLLDHDYSIKDCARNEEEWWDEKSVDLKIGLKFPNRDSVKKYLKMYGEENNTNMVISKGGLSDGCKSKQLQLKCSYSDKKPSVAREDGRPNQHSKHLGCGAFINFFVRGNKTERKLCVLKDFSDCHNHLRTREMYFQDTQKLTEVDELAFVAESLKLNVKATQVKKCAQEKFNKPGLSTDHIRYLMKKMTGPDKSQEELASFLKKVENDGGKIEILRNEENQSVRVLTVQSKEMRRAYLGANPTVVLFDTTYGFCEEGYKMSGFCYSNDLTGHGELGQLVFLADEGVESLEFAFQSFQKSIITCPKFFMIDKDFNEIRTIEKVFKSSTILLCQFHVLKYLKTIINTSRAASGSDVIVDIERKLNLMTLVRDMLYSKTELKMNESLEKFKDKSKDIEVKIGNGDMAQYKNLAQYFHKNWESCTHLWVTWKRVNIPGLEDNTNNKLERLWRSLKEYLRKSSSGSAPISKAVILMFKFVESQIADRYTWHQRHIMRIACNDKQAEEEIKKASAHLNDGGMLKLKQSLELLRVNKSNLEVIDEGVKEIFSKRNSVKQDNESLVRKHSDVSDETIDEVSEFENPDESKTALMKVTVQYVSDESSDAFIDINDNKHAESLVAVGFEVMEFENSDESKAAPNGVTEKLNVRYISDESSDAFIADNVEMRYVSSSLKTECYVSNEYPVQSINNLAPDKSQEALVAVGNEVMEFESPDESKTEKVNVRYVSDECSDVLIADNVEVRYVSSSLKSECYVSKENPGQSINNSPLDKLPEALVKSDDQKKEVIQTNLKIYNTDEKHCNCSWHIKTSAPCRHILFIRVKRGLSLFDLGLFHTRYWKERAFDLQNDTLDITVKDREGQDSLVNLGDNSVVLDPLDVKQRAMSKGEKYRVLGPKCERLLDATLRNGTIKSHLYEKEFEVLIERAKQGESLLSDNKDEAVNSTKNQINENVLQVSSSNLENKFNLVWHSKMKSNKVGRPKESKVKFNMKPLKKQKKVDGAKEVTVANDDLTIICSYPYDKDYPRRNAVIQRDLNSLQPRTFITDGVVDFYFRYHQPDGPGGQTVFLISSSDAQHLNDWEKSPVLKRQVLEAKLFDGGANIVFMAWCEFSHFFGIVGVCDESPKIYVLESIGNYPEPLGVAKLSMFLHQIRDSKALPKVNIPIKTLAVPRQAPGSNNCGIFLMKNATTILESPEEFLQKASTNDLAHWYKSESLNDGRAEIIKMIKHLQKIQNSAVSEMFGLSLMKNSAEKKIHGLKTMFPKLSAQTKVKKARLCGLCKEEGHTRIRCPLKP